MATALNKRMPRVIFNVKRSAYRGGDELQILYRYCKLCSNVAQQDKKSPHFKIPPQHEIFRKMSLSSKDCRLETPHP